MTLQDFLDKTYTTFTILGNVYQKCRPHVVCKDGYKISVQAGYGWYCEPRENGKIKYTSVELGFPNREDELINEYAEDPDDLCGTVYGYVPAEIVEELILKHGGFAEIDKWQETLNSRIFDEKSKWDLLTLFKAEG